MRALLSNTVLSGHRFADQRLEFRGEEFDSIQVEGAVAHDRTATKGMPVTGRQKLDINARSDREIGYGKQPHAAGADVHANSLDGSCAG